MSDQPADPWALAAQIGGLIERRRFEQARSMLGSALKQHPDHPQLLYQSAYVDYVTDRLDEAQATLAALIAADPENAAARELTALLLAEQGKQFEAERVWIELLREYPQEPQYFGGYAHLMLKTLKLDKARRLASAGLKLDPENHDCLFVAALCEVVARGDDQGAQLVELLRKHPESAASALVLVVALQQRGDLKGAHRIAQELLRAVPDNPNYLEITRDLKAQSHWSMLPLWPLQRWGWGASAALWLIVFGTLKAAEKTLSSTTVFVVFVVWLVYVVYSWVWPRVIRKLV